MVLSDQARLDAAQLGLQETGSLRLRVNGDSMRPFLRPGDLLNVEAVAPASLQAGDVVVVRRASDFVTHRLTARSAEGWVTKGDASRSPDPAVQAAAVLGRVAAVEREGRRFDLHKETIRRRGRRIATYSRWEGAAWQWVYNVSGRLVGRGSLAARALAGGISLPLRVAMRMTARLG